jgi:ATP-grasp domain
MFPAFINISIPRALKADSTQADDGSPVSSKATPETRTVASTDEASSVVSSVSDDLDFAVAASSSLSAFRVKPWDLKSGYSDYIRDGLRYLNRNDAEVVMLFESPSSASSDSTFFNCQVYKFHDYPPCSSLTKAVLGPCRYALMNGASYPAFLANGSPPEGLVEHWEATVPGFVRPSFVSEIKDTAQAYAYLPCESIKTHVNDPYVHYHMAGKDALHLMTKRTPKMLSGTNVERPCIAKTTHSMGSKGIFVIRNDDDEAQFKAFLEESGNPTFVVTDFIEIDRNVACHFFIHPSGEVTFFGSNENHREADGRFSLDSYLLQADQDHLREIQLPFVQDVANYCHSLGFWGFCGVDVLFDKSGQGYLVDVNPRVTGSCPSLMVATLLKEKYGFDVGLFRRSAKINYFGSSKQLFEEVASYNEANEGQSKVVIFSSIEMGDLTKINIGVYGFSLDECRTVLNHFANPKPER